MRPGGSAAELEAHRRLAASLRANGSTCAEIAEMMVVDLSSVKRLKTAWKKGGIEALAAKPHPGRTPRLSPSQKRRLEKTLLRGPVQAGYQTDLWTCARVAEAIHKQFGVDYHVDHVGRLLGALGWTCQEPEQRARERDEAKIADWRSARLASPKKRARGEKLALSSRMRAVSCSSPRGDELGHRVARRPCSMLGYRSCCQAPFNRRKVGMYFRVQQQKSAGPHRKATRLLFATTQLGCESSGCRLTLQTSIRPSSVGIMPSIPTSPTSCLMTPTNSSTPYEIRLAVNDVITNSYVPTSRPNNFDFNLAHWLRGDQ